MTLIFLLASVALTVAVRTKPTPYEILKIEPNEDWREACKKRKALLDPSTQTGEAEAKAKVAEELAKVVKACESFGRVPFTAQQARSTKIIIIVLAILAILLVVLGFGGGLYFWLRG
jgi:hypothetical protein